MSALGKWLAPFQNTVVNPKYRRFLGDFRRFSMLSAMKPRRFQLDWDDRYPCLDDRTAETGYDPHYTYHPAWAAAIIAQNRPTRHVDISSTLAFCTMLAAFVPVGFYDIRPARLNIKDLTCDTADLTSLPFDDRSQLSLSCMHVAEHVGLGRYGDPLDPDGDLKSMHELQRVLAPGGTLLFVVPVGRPCIRFNAHRIYSFRHIMTEFAELRLRQFALVDDRGLFTVDAPPAAADAQEYGCGCWWFER
jgi:SAM-dependent methyltransferase